MKKIFRTLSVIAVMTTVAACSDGIEEQNPNGPGTGEKIRIEFTAENPDTGGSSAAAPDTRTSIHIGDGTFVSRWDDGNEMALLSGNTAAKATYSSATKKFSTQIAPGAQSFHAFSPYVGELSYSGSSIRIPFGNLRTQNGNNFNHLYDPLVTTAAQTLDPATDELDFTLKRLTSILKFEISGGSDQVKALLLTSDETQPISSSAFIGSTDGTGSLDTSTPDDVPAASNVIAMTFDEGTAPSLSDLHAYFNLPEGSYSDLKLDIITANDQMGTIDLTALPPFEAGELYRLKRSSAPAFTDIQAPYFEWKDEHGNDMDMDEAHDITILTDENGDPVTNEAGLPLLSYPAAIDINVPGGIAGLTVDIASPALNNLGLFHLDLFTDTVIPDLEIPYVMLGLNSGVEIQYKKSCVFDITALVPMISMLPGADPGSLHVFNVSIIDLAGQKKTQALTFTMPSPIVYNKDADLWANTASFTLRDIPAEASSVTVQYKKSTESAWQTARVNADRTKAEIAPEWGEELTTADWTTPNAVLPYQRIKAETGVFANHNYDYKLTVDNEEYTGQFTTKTTQTIPDGDMEDSKLPCFTADGSKTTSFWGSGNNSMTQSLCKQANWKDGNRAKCQSTKAPLVSILAAGNLFTGTFRMADTYTGEVSFGQKYEWDARPTAMKVSYHATVGSIDRTDGVSTPIAKGKQDKARIFFCIIDWSKQHIVSSTPKITFLSPNPKTTGAWDPELTLDPGEGKIIGYGSLWIEESTGTDNPMNTISIPVNYYDTAAKPAEGNYSIIISCACNAYGDYFNGCSSNTLYVDDFEWVY